MSDPDGTPHLFDLALEPLRRQLRLAGAWPAGLLGPGRWRLPGGEIVSEQEALAWLRAVEWNRKTDERRFDGET